MKNSLFLFFIISLLGACAGIPLRSLPQLMQLQNSVLSANPAEFMVAIQVDQRMVPPATAVPVLQLAVRPSKPGAFETVNKKLPMHFATATFNTLGLASPPAHRRWLIYSLTPASQIELQGIQHYFKQLQAQHKESGGATVAVGIAQEGVAVNDPALASTQWESWLQVSRQAGFFELWSGSVAELLKQAKAHKDK